MTCDKKIVFNMTMPVTSRKAFCGLAKQKLVNRSVYHC